MPSAMGPRPASRERAAPSSTRRGPPALPPPVAGQPSDAEGGQGQGGRIGDDRRRGDGKAGTVKTGRRVEKTRWANEAGGRAECRVHVMYPRVHGLRYVGRQTLRVREVLPADDVADAYGEEQRGYRHGPELPIQRGGRSGRHQD